MDNEITIQIAALNSTISIYRIVGWIIGIIGGLGTLTSIVCSVMVVRLGDKVALLKKSEEIVALLNKVEESPSEFRQVYSKLQVMPIPVEHYVMFKKLLFTSINLSAQFPSNEMGISQHPEYNEMKNETLPLLLKLFPDEVFQDSDLMTILHKNDLFHDLSNAQRKRCITALYKSVEKNSLQKVLPALERILTDITQYDPQLFSFFKETFGSKMADLRELWTDKSFNIVMMPPEMRSILKENEILK
jgi:hypothetical protein